MNSFGARELGSLTSTTPERLSSLDRLYIGMRLTPSLVHKIGVQTVRHRHLGHRPAGCRALSQDLPLQLQALPPAITNPGVLLGVHLTSLVDTIVAGGSAAFKAGLPDAYAGTCCGRGLCVAAQRAVAIPNLMHSARINRSEPGAYTAAGKKVRLEFDVDRRIGGLHLGGLRLVQSKPLPGLDRDMTDLDRVRDRAALNGVAVATTGRDGFQRDKCTRVHARDRKAIREARDLSPFGEFDFDQVAVSPTRFK